MKLDPESLGRFAAVVLLLAGYLGVFRPYEAAIAGRYRDLDDARTRLEQRRAFEARALALSAQQQRLRAQLEALGLYDRRAEAVARFLRVVAVTAGRDRVEVTAVAADGTLPAFGAPATGAPASLFDELPLSLSLRGTYLDVLHFFADLDRGAFAARIGVQSIASGERPGTAPALQASLHVTLLRLAQRSEAARGRD